MLDYTLMLFLSVIALLIGFVKSGLPAMGALASIIVFLVFGRDALGIVLIYFIAGDILAVYFNWRRADIKMCLAMLPALFIGMAIASLVLNDINETWLNLIVGSLITLLAFLEPFRESLTRWSEKNRYIVRNTSGVLAGFTTTIGNVAGPVIAIYFLLMQLDKYRFVGTAAVIFFIVNISKLPVYLYVGIFQDYYLLSCLITLPLVFLGGFLGKRFLHWIPQKYFNQTILLLTGLSGLWLVIKTLSNL